MSGYFFWEGVIAENTYYCSGVLSRNSRDSIPNSKFKYTVPRIELHICGRVCKESLKISILPGFFSAITVVFYTLAISLANVAYSVAVCRLSLLVGVLYGHFLFKETGFRERLAGTTFMLVGFVIIVLEQ